MSQFDNSLKYNRTKEIAYWQLQGLNNLYSLSETVLHHPYTKLHSERDYDWRNLFFLKKIFIKGKEVGDTFISQSLKYLGEEQAFDRVSVYKSQVHQLEVAKYQFWNRIYHLKPTTKEAYKCKSILNRILWRERFIPFSTVFFFATIVNALSGIAQLKMSKRLLTFGAFFIAAQIIVRVRQSSSIFYSIPELPDPVLQEQRKTLIRECLVLDGKINAYDLQQGGSKELERVALKQTSQQQKRDILEVIGYNVIGVEDLTPKANIIS